MIPTISMCSKCYREVPAFIRIADTVTITKHCPDHGAETGTLEVDPSFYMEVSRHPSRLYTGHMIDVTTRCNLSCKYCYFDKGGADIPIGHIINECRVTTGPYILTGGEPTLREDLPEILSACSKVGPTMFLTNGHGLLDKNYLMECNKYTYGIGLSFHAEFDGFDEVVENLYSTGTRLDTVFFVIDSLHQIDHIIEFARQHRKLAKVIRIKAASNIWDERGAGNTIYISQILKAFRRRGAVIVASDAKSVYVPFLFDGIEFAAVAWHSIHNVDLLDIACPPTYRAQNGAVNDFVKSMLINEGLAKGFLGGLAI